jgi:hypothetical protein
VSQRNQKLLFRIDSAAVKDPLETTDKLSLCSDGNLSDLALFGHSVNWAATRPTTRARAPAARFIEKYPIVSSIFAKTGDIIAAERPNMEFTIPDTSPFLWGYQR